MITLRLTSEQYGRARAAIRESADVVSYTESTVASGTLTTKQVALSYGYSEATGELSVVVAQRFGFLARNAPEALIQKRLEALLKANEF